MITYQTFLMKKESSTWSKLVDIKDFPDLGGAPEMIETTTLSNRMKTYEPGIQNTDALVFTCAYSLTDYKTLVALKDTENEYAVWLGGTESGDSVTPTGNDGKFKFKGKLDVYKTGGGINEHQEMKITIAPTTIISLDEGT